MLCDICKKNNATLHIKNNINGIIIEKDICSQCYDKALTKDYSSTIGDFFQALSSSSGFASVPTIKCSACGTKLPSIIDSLFVGCPNCYKELSDYILPSIKNVQNAVLHEGKHPLETKDTAVPEYQRLKKELEKAIATENFEQAGIISARLKQLRGETNEQN